MTLTPLQKRLKEAWELAEATYFICPTPKNRRRLNIARMAFEYRCQEDNKEVA